MSLKEKVAGSFESFLLVIFMVWSIGIAVSVAQPDAQRLPHGTVEVYSLVSADSQPSA
jgi:hypothetical protein